MAATPMSAPFESGPVPRSSVALSVASTKPQGPALVRCEKEAEASIGEQGGRSGRRSVGESRPNHTLTADIFVYGMRRPSWLPPRGDRRPRHRVRRRDGQPPSGPPSAAVRCATKTRVRSHA
jgi:hypothetical protein